MNPMKKHEKFIMDLVLPCVFAHAQEVKCDPIEAAMAVFLSLGTILQEGGFSDADLFHAIKASAKDSKPETMQ
ncbi:hypothetical protein ACM5Q9_09700 [Advenella sp. RU8]|uniref:hypothetical protein n=1 Tax=Advenella sp. RU8 TaxID=3399575 RepID=UPI003AAF2552